MMDRMKAWSPVPSAITLVLLSGLAACGPNDGDRTNMTEKMDLESKRADIWKANLKSCPKLGAETAAFTAANKERIEKVDKWWGGLGTSAKKQLIAEHQAAWDAQSKVLVSAAMACPSEVKVSVKGQ
ncbi:MAG: hypothetical protein JWP97_5461 [Labilithrix sp.]|nr:hypothetical protein [Labilithrix sp.]